MKVDKLGTCICQATRHANSDVVYTKRTLTCTIPVKIGPPLHPIACSGAWNAFPWCALVSYSSGFSISRSRIPCQAHSPQRGLYLTSSGGSVASVLGIRHHAVVHICCLGQAASMGSFLLAAGEKGKRHAIPNSSVMIHQPLGGVQGQAADIAIHAKEIPRVRDTLTRIYASHCRRTSTSVTNAAPKEGVEFIETEEGAKTRFDVALERDNFMNAEEARAFGIMDRILERSPRGAENIGK
ncbi:hypothetical protein CYLTODRAFT_423768 [Cylindrobasidium torrendii FP15055 ss-10]|uniref:ATP-dependent Clp protease proteolytic subunit n=1 Tax=Cylindrobasidium torrendii FP15055 ss-10 TaxID=1314674 RepID=A0A0D7B7D8_9AGAR|nr:hypothetical protein CYLTODRAFT_423768 [Cylindrobasidium torrendii FP15055 ss-10]